MAHSPLSQLQPIPYRQPSYSDAQRLFSPPPTAHAQIALDAPEEVDDGGWTVDVDQSAYIARVKKNRERHFLPSATTSFGMLLPSSENEDTAASVDAISAEVQAPSSDLALPKLESPNPTQEVQAGEAPAGAQDTPTQDTDAAIADLIHAAEIGLPLNSSMLLKLKELLGQPPTLPIPPSPSSAPLLVLRDPPPNAENHLHPPAPPNTVQPTQPHPRFGPALDARTGTRGLNQIPVGRSRWGISPSRPEPEVDRAESTTPTPNPILTPTQAQPLCSNPNPNSHPAPNPIAQTTTHLSNPINQPEPLPEPSNLLLAVAEAEDTSSDGGWVPDKLVRDWRRDVAPHTPPNHTSPPSVPPSLVDSVEGTGEVGVEVDGESVDTDLPTPGKGDEGVRASEGESTTPTPTPAPAAPASQRTDDRQTFGSTDGEERRPPRAQRAWEYSAVKWKRAPHPAYSPLFANRRILIQFPQPISKEDARLSMVPHFEKYGSVRMTWYHKPHARECQDIVLVFDEEEAVERCLSDPSHSHFLLHSHLAPPQAVEVSISLAPLTLTTVYVYVKITGQRSHGRSRSASPTRSRGESRDSRQSRRDPQDIKAEWHLRPVPREIDIDSIPSQRKFSHRPEYWARIRPQNVGFDSVARMAWEETYWFSHKICTLDLSRRVAEGDVIPRLCDYFVDIVDIVRPSNRDEGWLIGVGGYPDAQNLILELGKIPGFLCRRAVDSDGLDQRREPALAPPAGPTDQRQDFERQPSVGQPDDELPRPLPQQDNLTAAVAEAEPVKIERHVSPRLSSPAPSVPSLSSRSSHPSQHAPAPPTPPAAEPSPPPNLPLTPSPDAFDPRYPHLRKLLIPTYRGRTLREDLTEDTTRFYDDAAVFVGRLSKGQETEETLFERFARYGQICGIEYNPHLASSTYATARILYASSAGADRALQFEQGAVSFGSALKLERRRVLPSDVQMEIKLIDDFGRAYSPSMASQYSPPQHPIEDEMLFVQPPPLSTGLILPSLPQQGMQWFPFPPPPHIHPGLGPAFGHLPAPLPQGTLPTGAQGLAFHPGNDLGLMPMIYAMGVGYYPPQNYDRPSPSAGSGSLPTPPATPHYSLFPDHTNTADTTPTPTQTAPHPPIPPIAPSPTPSATQTSLPSTTPTPAVSSADPNSSSSRNRAPIFLGTVMENGVLKARYDDDDLKRYRREEGIAEPEVRVKEERAEEEPSRERGLGEVEEVAMAGLRISNGVKREVESRVVHRHSPSPHQYYQQRLHEIPIPFSPPPPHHPVQHEPARYSPEAHFRPFGPRAQQAGGVLPYSSSIDYGDQAQGGGRPGMMGHGQVAGGDTWLGDVRGVEHGGYGGPGGYNGRGRQMRELGERRESGYGR